MGECCGYRRNVRKYFEGNNQRACFLKCLPLAITPLFIGLLFIITGALFIAFKIITTLNEDIESASVTVSLYISVSLNALMILIGFLGFYVIARKNKGLKSLKLLNLCYIITGFTYLLIQIVSMILLIVDDAVISGATWTTHAAMIVYAVVLIALSYEVNSCCSSLRKVYTMGGSGWERKNAAEISTIHKMKAQAGDLLDHLVDVQSDI